MATAAVTPSQESRGIFTAEAPSPNWKPWLSKFIARSSGTASTAVMERVKPKRRSVAGPMAALIQPATGMIQAAG